MLYPWWRYQMEIFSALLVLCVGNSSVTDEFPAQRSVTRSFDVFFDLRLNKQLSKQSWGWWFETQSRSLWSQCNAQRRHQANMQTTAVWTPLRALQMLIRNCELSDARKSTRPGRVHKQLVVIYVHTLICVILYYFPRSPHQFNSKHFNLQILHSECDVSSRS